MTGDDPIYRGGQSVLDFHREWERLAKLGQCDEPHGAAYNRVIEEWDHEGRPDPVATFIIQRANSGPYKDGQNAEETY